LLLTDASVVDLIDRFNVINFARLTRRDRSPELHVLGSLPLWTRANTSNVMACPSRSSSVSRLIVPFIANIVSL